MRTHKKLVLLHLFAFFCFAAPFIGQTPQGNITGRVTDTTGAALRGAQITIKGQSLPIVSDATGEFSLNGLAPGEQTVNVSYVGFAAMTQTVNVQAGQVTRLNVVLKVASAQNEIFVTAERPHGEAEAINRELSSDNILQVLPFDVITSLPNTNIADALGRLPSVTLERDEGEGKYVQIRGTEPRLSNVTIDGVNVASPEQSGVRQVKLDIVPANLVESVEIDKTLSANQDGDAIGGSVNLVSKTASEKPTLYLNGTGGLTPILGTRPLAEVDGAVGKRFGESKKFGALVGGSYDFNGRGINDAEPVPGVLNLADGTPFAGYNSVDAREYRYYRERFGLNGSLDLKATTNSNFYLRFLYSHFKNFGDRWDYASNIKTFASPTHGNADGNVTFGTQIRRPIEQIGNVTLGGNHVLNGRTVFMWNFAVSRSSQEDQGYSSADFGANDPASPINNVAFGVDRTNTDRPKLPVLNGVNIYDPTQFYLQDINFDRSYGAQLNVQGSLDVLRTYTAGSHAGTFQFGFKLRNAHKYNDPNQTFYNANTDVPTPNALQLTNFVSGFTDPGYYDKSYALGPLTDYTKIRNFFNSNPGLFTVDANQSLINTASNSYDVIERVTAGYLMNSIEFGRLRLQTGLRFEATQEDNLGNQIVQSSDGTLASSTPVRGSGSYLDALPSVQARFRITDDAAIRAVYGRGLSRPNFGDLVPFIQIDDRANQISVGNPKLKAEYANDYDLLYEQSLRPLGIIQAGFFYKDLSNPLVAVQTPVTSGVYAGFTQVQTVNAGSAHVAGFEVAYEHQLSFLPGLASGLGISANYSYTTSGTKGVSQFRTDNPALLRQAPNTWNISPTYDRKRLSLRVGISHNDASIFQYNYSNLNSDGTPNPQLGGVKGPAGDVYLYAHTQIDAQGSFRISPGLRFIASMLNANNEVFGFYQGSTQYPIQREYYKPTYSFGFRYSLSNEQ